MKKNDWINRLLCLAAVVLMLCAMPVLAMAEEEALTLNIADGAITITATGYSIDGAAETPYTGSYILTGTANTTGPFKYITVSGVADGAAVTLKDLDITTTGPTPVTTSVDLKATGTVRLQNSAPALVYNGAVAITGDADFVLVSNVPAINGGSLSLICNSLNASGSSGVSASDVTVNAAGDIIVSGSNPAIVGNADLTAGGSITVTSTNSNCVVGSAKMRAGGDITCTTTSTGATGITMGADLQADGNVTVTGTAYPAIEGKTNIVAGGDITVTNTSVSTPAISFTDVLVLDAAGDINIGYTSTGSGNVKITAGGDFNLDFAGQSPALATSGGTVELDVDGNATITSGGMAITAQRLDANVGGNFTVNGGKNSPAVSLSQASAIQAGGDVTVASAQHMAISGYELEINAGGSIAISGNNASPAVGISTLEMTAGENVTVANQGAGMALSAQTLQAQAQNVTLETAGGMAKSVTNENVKVSGAYTLTDSSGTQAFAPSATKFFYSGKKAQPAVTVNGTDSADAGYTLKVVDALGAEADSSKTGSYVLQVLKGSDVVAGLGFEVAAWDLDKAEVNTEKGLVYSGAEQTAAVNSVTVGGETVPAELYTVAGNTGKEIGAYVLTVSPKVADGVTGTASFTWYIIPDLSDVAELTEETVTADDVADIEEVIGAMEILIADADSEADLKEEAEWIIDMMEDWLEIVDATGAAAGAVTGTDVEDATEAELEAVIKQAEALLAGENLTDAQREAVGKAMEAAKNQLTALRAPTNGNPATGDVGVWTGVAAMLLSAMGTAALIPGKKD